MKYIALIGVILFILTCAISAGYLFYKDQWLGGLILSYMVLNARLPIDDDKDTSSETTVTPARRSLRPPPPRKGR